MKNISETFTDEEFDKLKEKKDGLSWHDFILKLIQGGSNGKQESFVDN